MRFSAEKKDGKPLASLLAGKKSIIEIDTKVFDVACCLWGDSAVRVALPLTSLNAQCIIHNTQWV